MHEQLLGIWRQLMDEGTRCLGQEDYEEAEKYFIQSSSTAEQLAAPEILAFSLRLLATTRVKLGELEIAEKGFYEALEICQDVQNAKGMAEAWAGLASVAFGRGFYPAAADYYERSIAVYPSGSPQLRLGMLYSDLGQTYSYLESWDQALQAYGQARDLCHYHGYPKGEGELKVLIGEIFYRQGHKAEAEKWVKEACRIFAGIDDPSILANALQYMALIYYDQNRMELAREVQRRAVALWLKHNILAEASESCYFLSKIEQNLDDNAEAQAYIELSIQLYKEEDIGLALRYQSLAGLALTALDLGKAEEHFLAALNLFQILGEEIKAGEVCETLAFLVDFDGRNQEALRYHERAVKLLSSSAAQAAEAVQELATFYEKYQNYRKALETYWSALHLARENNFESEGLEVAIQRVSRVLRKKGKG